MKQVFYVVRHPAAGYVMDIGRNRGQATIRLHKVPQYARLYATLGGAKRAAERCMEHFGAGFVVEEREVERL